MMKNIVILISGRGSNMQAIVEAHIPNARIAAVISNSPTAAGLTWARQRAIPTESLDHRQFDRREAFDAALIDIIDRYQPDVVVLAGFMRILTAEFTQHYAGRLLNIHPSLLPMFPGLHTHERALLEGCKLAGCTVHFVTSELDHGPIIVQGAVPVLDNDTPDTLAQRVLAVEHQIYPQAVADFLAGRLHIDVNGRVKTQRETCNAQAALIVPAVHTHAHSA